MIDENRLTVKQRKFADEILAGESQRQAVINAGYSCSNENVIKVRGYRLATHPNVRQFVMESLDAAGVSPFSVACRINELMHTEIADDEVGGKRISLDAAKELNKMLGTHAPSESRALRVSASLQSRDTRELAYLARHGRRPTAAELADKDTDE